MISTISNKRDWDQILGQVDNYDFYHTYDYHRISSENNNSAMLVKYQRGNTLIAIPLIVRAIESTKYNDVTSAYGYCGPVSKNITSDFDNEEFAAELQNFLNKKKIATVFSRLNPFIDNQCTILNTIGDVEELGKVVNIDLTLSLENQQKAYQKRLKTYINKCKKQYVITRATSELEIKKFVAIYYENMLRVNAKDKYFFSGNYFNKLWKSKDFQTDFLLAYDIENHHLAGGAVFVKKNNIIQYHLSGAKEEYLNLNPVKALIDEMRITATKEGYKYFNLGGGVGTNYDSLFNFKSRFSKDFKAFKVWKYIVNQEVYNELIGMKHENGCGRPHEKCQVFFPCYRCTIDDINENVLSVKVPN